MLSSVSSVCLGACAGMWVISRVYIWACWNFGSVVKYFVFTVLPFGLSSAPYIFSKLVRSLVNYWRGLGRRVVTFLDDGVGGSPDYASCLVHSRLSRSDLDSTGFFVNLQKSEWGRLKSVPGLVSILISVLISSPFLFRRLRSYRRVFRISLLCILLTLRI